MNETQGFSEFHERRLSNGAKAAQIAAQHFSELEQVNEKQRIEIDTLQRELSSVLGRLDDANERALRMEHERNEWQSKAVSLATSIGNSLHLIAEMGAEARQVVNLTAAPPRLPRVEEHEQ